jgi:sugar lactone lactonase YvrE
MDGRNGIIVVDLGTGDSWRHLEMHPSTLPDEGLIASYNGESFLPVYPKFGTVDQWRIGTDGLTLSPDGEWLYYAALAARTFWKVPTSALLRNTNPHNGGDPLAAWSARRSVVQLGRLPSHGDGYESDTDGNVYLTAPEMNGVYVYNPKTEMTELYVRDELIQWPATLAVSYDKKLYITAIQSWL